MEGRGQTRVSALAHKRQHATSPPVVAAEGVLPTLTLALDATYSTVRCSCTAHHAHTSDSSGVRRGASPVLPLRCPSSAEQLHKQNRVAGVLYLEGLLHQLAGIQHLQHKA